MPRTAQWIALSLGLATAALAAGCATNPSRTDEFRRAVPRTESLVMHMPGDGAGSEAGGARAALIGETATFYGYTRQWIDGVNGYVFALRGVLDAVLDTDPVWRSDDTAVFGPFGGGLEPARYLVIVHARTATEFDLAILAKPRAASDDAYRAVLGGTSELITEDLSRGAIAIDGAVLHELDPIGHPDQVNVWIEYDEGTRQLHVAMLDGAPSPAGIDAQAVDYRYGSGIDGAGGVIVVAHGGVDAAGAANPDFFMGSQWTAAGAGRSDFAERGGALGADVVVGGLECWDDGFGRSFFADTLGDTEGDAASCAFSSSIFDAMGAAGGST